MLAKNMRKLFKSSFSLVALQSERRRDSETQPSETTRKKKKVDNKSKHFFWRCMNEFVSIKVMKKILDLDDPTGFVFFFFFFGDVSLSPANDTI